MDTISFYAVQLNERGQIIEVFDVRTRGTRGRLLSSEPTGITYRSSRAAMESVGAKNRETYAAARAAA